MRISRPIRRRLIAAVLLYGFAIGSAYFWAGVSVNWLTLGTNLASASAGLLYLHFSWRKIERQAMTPQKIKDTFS